MSNSQSGMEKLPLQARFSTKDIKSVNMNVMSKIFEADTTPHEKEVDELKYSTDAEYKPIGHLSDNPSLDSSNIADAIALLDIEVLEKLKRLGFLIVPNSGEYQGNYYLISKYRDVDITDLLQEIVALDSAFVNQTTKAMSVNGLSDGVMNNTIQDIPDYLTSHKYDFETRKQNLLNKLDDIEHDIFLEYRLSNLIK